METKGNIFLIVRVDPWECYQDTWQTTCSVLEHHRDLMKVSWAQQPTEAGQARQRMSPASWPLVAEARL